MKLLTKDQLISMHQALIDETGEVSGLRDDGLLDSALHAPFQGYDDIQMYPSLQQKAARLGYGIIKNHHFMDGNKRIGAHAMLVFLELNGIPMKYTQKELYSVILDVASGTCSSDDLVEWITQHQQQYGEVYKLYEIFSMYSYLTQDADYSKLQIVALPKAVRRLNSAPGRGRGEWSTLFL